jgi:arabinose-5-phosphate isomerase
MDENIVSEAVSHLLSVQVRSIAALQDPESIGEILQVAEEINERDGRVIVSGIGKSGDVSKKISSTFNSIGVPSHFIHPVEALHGDLGGLSSQDIVILISNSGNTEEVIDFWKYLSSGDITTVAITSSPDSKLGQQTDYHVSTKVDEEGAVVELVPMTSATVTMVIGDCIINALIANWDFDRGDYGDLHPGGAIGKCIFLNVEDISYEDIPRTYPSDKLAQVAVKIGEGGKGIAVIQDDENQVQGILTDGDIRRLIENGTDLHDIEAKDVMITDPITVTPDTGAMRALEILEDDNVTQLVVTDESNRFCGVVHISDITSEGLDTYN